MLMLLPRHFRHFFATDTTPLMPMLFTPPFQLRYTPFRHCWAVIRGGELLIATGEPPDLLRYRRFDFFATRRYHAFAATALQAAAAADAAIVGCFKRSRAYLINSAAVYAAISR